jgi:hypothetical protein
MKNTAARTISVTRKKFEVTFEDVGFTADPQVKGFSMSPGSIREFNDKDRSWPTDVLKLISVRVSSDDEEDDTDGDYKVFVSISLQLIADSEDAAEAYRAPRGLLDAIFAALQISANSILDMDGNWENTDVSGS